MPRIKVDFPNAQGDILSGALEMPDSEPAYYALFAHCFTCSKDIAAASRIARGLAAEGVAVLRFDFTGLGNSDGDFANTNFSSNLEDLISAAEYLEKNYAAPAVLIGHSLGGAAVMAVANSIPSTRAIVTIGAPATADHIEHLLKKDKDRILDENKAVVSLGNREFTIKKQFLQDIAQHNTVDHIAGLGKPLLILHSPVDELVSIDEAAKIYTAARHPKSFISLDNADHLLSRKADSEYVSKVVAAWVSRYLELQEPSSSARPAVKAGHVLVTEQNRNFTRNIYTESHRLVADEPLSFGGNDLGPNPYEYLLSALGACTSMTVRMYARRKNIALDNIDVELIHDRIHADDCEDCDKKDGFIDIIKKQISLTGGLSDAEKGKLLEIADNCPIHKTLLNEIRIHSSLDPD